MDEVLKYVVTSCTNRRKSPIMYHSHKNSKDTTLLLESCRYLALPNLGTLLCFHHLVVNQGHVLVSSHKRMIIRSPSSCHVLRADVRKQFILPFPELSTFKGFVLHTAANTFAACISHLQYLDPETIKLLTFGASCNYLLLLLLLLMGIVLSFLSSFPEHLRGL